MNNQEIYRPRTNLTFAGIGIVLCGLFTWSSFYEASVASKVASVLIALFALLCIYTFLIHPKITFSDEGIVITNPLDEYTIGWGEVIAIDTRWALSIESKEFKVNAWAATASGRHRKSIHHADVRGLNIDQGGSIRTADSPFTDSGAAAYRARIRLKRFEEARTYQSLTASHKRHLQPIIAALVILCAAIVITVVGH